MIASKFDPLKHALPYRNGSFKFKVGPISCSVLCGGISYTALDYFYTGIQPPQSPKTPADGNPMEEYLYRRQATAHYYTWHRFAAVWAGDLPVLSPITGPLIGGLTQDTLEDLCKHLPYRPVILCLFGGMGEGHHVVASACDPEKKQIHLYDSNHPGRISLLTQVSDGWLHSISGTKWKGWFMDWGHYHDGTKMPPLAFRYCRICHGLNTNSLGVQGGCINGGGHDNHPDFEYFLPWKAGEGQGGWKVCGKCQGLYRQTGSDVPFCPTIGMHLPQMNNANWQELHVRTSGVGETGWRRCSICTGLFWTNNRDLGKCSSGVGHSPVPNESYVVDNRTV
jgi:hypothetical protein